MIDRQKLPQALALLRDENLVWDKDFEPIRESVKTLLVACTVLGTSGPANRAIQIDMVHEAANRLLADLVKD